MDVDVLQLIFIACLVFGAGYFAGRLERSEKKDLRPRAKFRKKSNRFVEKIDAPPLLDLRDQGFDNPAIAKKSGWSCCTISQKIGRQPVAADRKALRREWLKKQRELKKADHVSP